MRSSSRDELRQARAARVLVRVLARGVALVGVELRDPDVLEREARALRKAESRLRERQAVLARHEAVADRLARPRSLRSWLTTSQLRGESGSISLRRLGLAVAAACVRASNAFPNGLSGPGGRGLGVHLVDGVRSPSRSKSRRALKKCWWFIAFRPSATSVP